MLFFFGSLFASNYKITIESSDDLKEWALVHTASVSSEKETNFYRAKIEAIIDPIEILESTTLTVMQTWSQETNYERTAHVNVPNSNEEKYPVIIFFHGSGGSGNAILSTFNNHFENFIKVGMNGYLNKWNIKSEPTKANDIEFLDKILSQLKSYSNVDDQRITLIGLSNGAGIVIKALIELPEDAFHNGIHIATQATEDQYRNNAFWYNNHPNEQYLIETTLPNRNKILNFHGTSDSVIPYNGGNVSFLNSTFYNAHESTYHFAKGLGYQENILSGNGGNTANSNIKEFSYLDNRVVHYKVLNGDHSLQEHMSDIVNIIKNHIE